MYFPDWLQVFYPFRDPRLIEHLVYLNEYNIFIDGSGIGAQEDTAPVSDLSDLNQAIVIGAYGGSLLLTGWMDEFRISDVVRYTTDFTPPTEPFEG